MYLLVRVQTQHLFKSISWTIEHTLEGYVTLDGKDVGVRPVTAFVNFARKVADTTDEASPFDTFIALPQCLSTAIFEYDVHALVICSLEYLVVPFRALAVVDDLVCPELFGLFELLIR